VLWRITSTSISEGNAVAKKVALINMKGGVGKSTLAVNLAWHFALRPTSKRVLLVDLDPQFNASQYLLGAAEYRRAIESGVKTIWDIFERGTRHPQAPQAGFSIHDAIYNRFTIPSENRKLDIILSRLDLAFSVKTPYQQKERELAEVLTGLEGEYDLVLFDCPPTESILTTAGYLASDYVLVPVRPEYLSEIGLPLLVQSMEDFAADYPEHPLQLAGVVFNATTDYAPEEMLAKAGVRVIAQRNGWYVFEARYPFLGPIPKAPGSACQSTERPTRGDRSIAGSSHSRMNLRGG
jgi:chromosome partitioning protein